MRTPCEDCANTAALFCDRHAAVFVEGGLKTQEARDRNKRARKAQERPQLFDVTKYTGSFRYFGDAP